MDLTNIIVRVINPKDTREFKKHSLESLSLEKNIEQMQETFFSLAKKIVRIKYIKTLSDVQDAVCHFEENSNKTTLFVAKKKQEVSSKHFFVEKFSSCFCTCSRTSQYCMHH